MQPEILEKRKDIGGKAGEILVGSIIQLTVSHQY